MSMPWSRPDPPTTFSIGDHAGQVVLVIVGGYHPAVATRSFGEKPAARVTVVVLTGPVAGSVFDDVMFFGQKLSSQFISSTPGQVVLGRITKVDKSVTIDAASTYDEQTAMAWMQAFPGKLDQLRGEAVRNFQTEAAKLAANAGPAPAPSQQFQPPQMPTQAFSAAPPSPAYPPPASAAPADVTPSQAYAPWQPNGGTQSSTQPGAPAATPEEAGF